MKIPIIRLRIIVFAAIMALAYADAASAYWVWTPETKKFLNPKYAVKDSPKEQYDWAMSFYEAKDYPRAISEFDKLTKSYEFSEYAGKAQYHIGLCYENMAKYYLAFQAYQKAIENFPHLDNVDEIIAREFNIANIYSAKENPKVLGTDIMTPTERVVEIYRKVVDNAPYGKLADESLFNMGTVLKSAERYDEAIPAFQKILDEYPDSKFTERARYEVAYCAYKSSLQPAYDQASTDKAIKAFSEFSTENKDVQLTQEADKTIQRLKDKAAEKSLQTAQFYEKIKKKESAIVYYKDILDRYPDCSYVELAKTRIEELKTGKPRPKIVTAQAPKGGLFGLWPAKAPAGASVASPESVQPELGQAAPVSGQSQEAAKKGWLPFSFGKKEPSKGKEVKSAEATASMPKKWSWSPLNFGKKEAPKPSTEDKAAQVNVPVPAVEVMPSEAQSQPVALQQSQEPASTQEGPSQIPEPQIALPADQGVSASVPVQSAPAAQPSVPQPIAASVSSPVASDEKTIVAQEPAPPIQAPCKPAAPYKPKKKGWNLADILGLGSDTPEKAKKVPAKSKDPDAPAVAEPMPDASDPAPSTDDPNLDKDDYIY